MEGTFADFLNELRAFESGVSEERIAQSRDQVIELVGADRFAAFEAGEITLTDLQYSSTNFLGFVGYQFGEPILIDLEYYTFDSTPGVNDFSGTFTGKNGVNSLDDLKTNVQEQIIVDEFALNLGIIQNGLANSGQSLDDFIGETLQFTDVDGSTVEVELSLTGLLAAAHLRGPFGTLNLLQNGTASADEIGTSILQFAEQFGGFDAPSIEAIINGEVPPLVTDSVLRPGGQIAFNDDGNDSDNQSGADDTNDQQNNDPPADPDDPVGEETGDGQVAQPSGDDQTDDGQTGDEQTGDEQTDGGQVEVSDDSDQAPSNSNDEENVVSDNGNPFGSSGIPDAPANAPTQAAAVQIRDFDPATLQFTVTGTNGVDGSAYGERADDVVFAFDGDDDSVGFGGNDFLDGGAGNDTLWGTEGNDALLGQDGNDRLIGGVDNDILVGGRGNDLLRGDSGADRFVFAPGDGNDTISDFEIAVDVLDFTEFGNDPDATVRQDGANTVVTVGDVTVTLQNIQANSLTVSNFIGASLDGQAGTGDTGADNSGGDADNNDGDANDGNANDGGTNDGSTNDGGTNDGGTNAGGANDGGANNDDTASDNDGGSDQGDDTANDNSGGGTPPPDSGIPPLPAGAPTAAAAVFTRTFDPETGSFTVTGTDGIDSAAYGENGDDIIRTFGGNDSSLGFAGNDFQDLGAGNDRGWGLEGDDILIGGDGDDVLNGDEGDALGTGVASGSDVLVGGRGNDVLRGDSRDTNVAADRFVFAAGDGDDTVRDFQVDLDILDFTEFDGTPTASLNQQGGNTVVSVGDVTVTLEGVAAGELTAQNFLGVDLPGDSDDSNSALSSLTPDDGLVA